MRDRIVAGNWKMYGNLLQTKARLETLATYKDPKPGLSVVVFPSVIYMHLVQKALQASAVAWGAQTVSEYEEGAYTGETSVDMLRSYGCEWVIIGHSERRQYFNETDLALANKLNRALEAGLRPIYCVGESQEAYRAKSTKDVIEKQINAVLSKIANVKLLPRLVVAYEPVWAIGTGLTATPEYANEVHGFIREMIGNINSDCAESTPILYGGSVKADNAENLFSMEHIDGGLVGGASLDPIQFLEIVRCIK